MAWASPVTKRRPLWTADCSRVPSVPAGTPPNKLYWASSGEGNLWVLRIVASGRFILGIILKRGGLLRHPLNDGVLRANPIIVCRPSTGWDSRIRRFWYAGPIYHGALFTVHQEQGHRSNT